MPRPGCDNLNAHTRISNAPGRRHLPAALLRSGVGLVLLTSGVAFPSAPTAAETLTVSVNETSFGTQTASAEARKVAAWVIQTDDNGIMPFIIVDKVNAKVFAFNQQGQLVGAAPVLLGLARGDKSPEGIGDRKLSSISHAERITPAGRFVAALGENLGGKGILWVDYDAAISLHRVDTAKPEERRLQRLATPAVSDNRISYGCINVPVRFYEKVVASLFKGTVGIVYILPETQTVDGGFFADRPR